MTLNSREGTASPAAKKPWKKPEVRLIQSGSAENGGNTTTNGDSPSGGIKS
jgi:hypothetical protein